jgi:hypothetical protein
VHDLRSPNVRILAEGDLPIASVVPSTVEPARRPRPRPARAGIDLVAAAGE